MIRTGRLMYLFFIAIAGGCTSINPSPDESWQAKPVLETRMQEDVNYFRKTDTTIRKFFDNCYGLAVFYIDKAPSAGGGAFGRGQVYEQGQYVGTASISQRIVGFAVPGEHFREIIFFEDNAGFENFKTHGLIFGPDMVGIALSDGVAVKSNYAHGMAVFIMADDGPMSDSSLAGQTFIYAPMTQ